METEASFQFTADSAETRIIRGNLHYAASGQPQGTIVIIHGFKGFKDWGMFPSVSERLAVDYDVIRFNLSRNGVGESLNEFDELEKFGRQTFTGDWRIWAACWNRLRREACRFKAGNQRPHALFSWGTAAVAERQFYGRSTTRIRFKPLLPGMAPSGSRTCSAKQSCRLCVSRALRISAMQNRPADAAGAGYR